MRTAHCPHPSAARPGTPLGDVVEEIPHGEFLGVAPPLDGRLVGGGPAAVELDGGEERLSGLAVAVAAQRGPKARVSHWRSNGAGTGGRWASTLARNRPRREGTSIRFPSDRSKAGA